VGQQVRNGSSVLAALFYGKMEPDRSDLLRGTEIREERGLNRPRKEGATAVAFLGELYIGGESSQAKLWRYESAKQRNLVRTQKSRRAYAVRLSLLLHEPQRPQAARKGHKNLTSITGIGGLSADVLPSTIGDINDFPTKAASCLLWNRAESQQLEPNGGFRLYHDTRD
jgi:hypothetical protein